MTGPQPEQQPRTRAERIALLGWYGSDNAGDEAVLQSVVASLKERGFSNLLALSIHPQHTAAKYSVDSVSRSLISPATLRALWGADALILGGGGLIQDSSSVYNLPLYAFYVALARLRGIAVIGWGLGAGPLHTRLGRMLAASIVRSSRYFSVRDIGSRRALEKAGAGKPRVTVTADPAFLIGAQGQTGEEAADTTDDELMPTIIFCVRHRLHDAPGLNLRYLLPVSVRHRLHIETRAADKSDDERFAASVARGVQLCVEEFGARVVLLPFWAGRDDEAVRGVEQQARALGVPAAKISWANVEHTPSSLARYIAQADLLVSMRLHALVFGAGAGVPVLALSYVPKVRALMRSLGAERWTVEVGTRVPAPEELEMKLRQLWAMRQAETSKLARHAASLRARAGRDAENIAGLL